MISISLLAKICSNESDDVFWDNTRTQSEDQWLDEDWCWEKRQSVRVIVWYYFFYKIFSDTLKSYLSWQCLENSLLGWTTLLGVTWRILQLVNKQRIFLWTTLQTGNENNLMKTTRDKFALQCHYFIIPSSVIEFKNASLVLQWYENCSLGYNTLWGKVFHWITLSQLLYMIRISTFKKKDVYVHNPIFNNMVNVISVLIW